MTNDRPALTEKEKETLRLLLAGHDAKSLARHLDLSVHTVNERLRDARRKLGVSSSREAARLLRDQEGPSPKRPDPDTDVPERLGAARAPGADQNSSTLRRPGLVGRSGWLLGGFVMPLIFALVALSSLGGGTDPAHPAVGQGSEDQANAENAVEAARQWLALVDARDWKGSWGAAASGIRSANTLEHWTRVVEQVHGKFGAARSRELVLVDTVPAPPNGYWLVKFRTTYANKPQGIETLSLARENNVWKVAGITVD